MSDNAKLKIIKRDTHAYGQSSVTYNRPITGADFMNKIFVGLDPNKSYKIVNGVFVEIGESN